MYLTRFSLRVMDEHLRFFVAQVQSILDGFDKGSYDHILLAQDIPVDIQVGQVAEIILHRKTRIFWRCAIIKEHGNGRVSHIPMGD